MEPTKTIPVIRVNDEKSEKSSTRGNKAPDLPLQGGLSPDL